MNEDSIYVSAKRKLDLLQRYHLLASMIEEYCRDKKMIKALERALKMETKKLAKSKYPLTDDDANTLTYMLEDLTDILTRYKKARKAEQFRIVGALLEGLFKQIEQEIVKTTKPIEEDPDEQSKEKSGVQKTIDKIIEKGNVLNAKIESKISENIDQLKNSLRARDSESD